MRILFAVILISCIFSQEEIVIGIKSAPPFVILSEEKPIGFSIDLIEEVFKNEQFKVSYLTDSNISKHLTSIEQKKVDLGIAATTVTFQRETRMDFSQPFYYSGLGILVRQDQTAKWTIIFSQETFLLLFLLAAYVFIIANVIWFFERKHSTFSSKWLRGIFESAWWAIVTMSTVGYGDFSPKTRIGRLIAIFVIFSGICLFSLLIASFSSALTVNRIHNNIKSINDTITFPVAVVIGTTSEKYMRRIHPNLLRVSSVEQALQNLKQGDVKVIIHDKPILRYHINKSFTPNLKLVDGIFFPSAYAIAFPIKSPLRKEVNIRLLEIMESELYQKLIIKWFGRHE